MNIKVTAEPGAKLPEYKTDGAAGADLFAFLPNIDQKIYPGDRLLVSTGLKMEIPKGYEAQIRPRSGMALNMGVTVLNSPGTIDSDYRGQVLVLLINHSNKPVSISHGDRIAQMVVAPVEQATFQTAETMSDTERGEGGFGHTGN